MDNLGDFSNLIKIEGYVYDCGRFLEPFLVKVLTPEQHEQAGRNEYNFDHVDAFDFDLCCETLEKLKKGKSVEIPIYDFTTHARKKQTVAN